MGIHYIKIIRFHRTKMFRLRDVRFVEALSLRNLDTLDQSINSNHLFIILKCKMHEMQMVNDDRIFFFFFLSYRAYKNTTKTIFVFYF